MATRLYLADTQTRVSGYYDLVDTQPGANATGVVNTAASGTNIQWTKTDGGTAMAWISPPVGAGFTLTTTDINIYAHESNMSANAGGRYELYKYSGGSEGAALGGGPFSDGVEFGVTTPANMTWVGNCTDTAFAATDRLVVKMFITNVGTMAAGYTCTLTYGASSYINLNEAVTFATESPAVTLGTPADGATINDTTPALTFTGTDPGAQEVEYEVQVDTAVGFDSSAANGNFDLKYVELKINKVNSPTDNIFLDIRTTSFSGSSSGKSNAVLASSLPVDGGITPTRFTFATPISVTGGTKYYLTISRSGVRDTSNYGAILKSNATYSSGGDSTKSSGSWSAEGTTYDIDFVVYDTNNTIRITYGDAISASPVYGGSGTNEEQGQSLTVPNGPLLTTLSSTDDDANWAGTGAPNPFPSGNEITYTIPVASALAANTYYWRVRAIDPLGSNTWGAWSPGDSTLGYDSFTIASASGWKTYNGLAKASVKTINSLPIASVKTYNGLA